MATALLETPMLPTGTPTGREVQVAILASPIRGRDGAWRTHRFLAAPTAALSLLLPSQLALARVIVNGRVIPPDAYATTPLLAGDELLLIPHWGIPAAIAPLILYAAASIAISIAISALTYVLFPPPKAHNIQHTPDEPSFSFEGIRTTTGPGASVPVIYGRQRTGGQLLSATVDQALTVLDTGTGFSVVHAVTSPATLTMLLALGEGPVATIDPSTILINGQPIANFPTALVSTALGTPDQAPLPYFGETGNTFADGRDLPSDSVPLIYTTTDPVHTVVLNIVFQSGLYAVNRKGDKIDNAVTLQYRLRVHPAGAWSALAVFEVVAARTSAVRFGIRREGLGLQQYDIEVSMTNASATENAGWQPTLESVTQIQNNVQAYPNTALLGLRAIATDSLQGALPNITVEVLGRTVRVGSFVPALTYSNNPAWCVMDFLTNPRYGLGIPDSAIDLGGFQVYATYCDQVIDGEVRHTLGYILDRDQRAQTVLLEMLGGSRTLLFKSEGLWTPRPTRNDPPVQLLSWANCTDLKLTYTRDPERLTVMEARFSNEEQDFQQDVLTWPTLENWPVEVRKGSLEVRGVTKPSRVMRAMQFELNRRRFENLQLEATFSLEAIVLQPHDLFRFSHPLPGWGVSGRLLEGSQVDQLLLDRPVQFVGTQSYVVYVRHMNDVVEMRPVSYPGDTTTSQLTLLSPLSQVPIPRETVWAFGHMVGAADTAIKIFRVVRMQRASDHTIQIQAVIHNPSIYDEADAMPLPITTELFNPLGPPPPLTSLIVRELTRVQSSGASLRVVNLSWDVAQLSAGYAPYGGAMIQRRTVMLQSEAAVTALGGMTAGILQDVNESASNFVPITQVNGHVLDWDDYTVITGTTYVYRVIPISGRGVPNMIGSRDVVISVTGPTTPGYYPGQVRNLRLKGKHPGETIFEGPDIHIEWDAVAESDLFTDTFFVQDYIVEVWAPGQLYLLHRTVVLAIPHQQTMTWSYTRAQNEEDSVAQGQPGAQRTVLILVWARTNTSLLSLDPAQMTVTNPPPDMSMIEPECTALFQAGIVDWHQYAQPRDFYKYEVYLDTITPPLALYQGVGIAFEHLLIGGLLANVPYYVYILPYDTFGPGIASQIASFTPAALDAEALDTVPPERPTGLSLTTGVDISTDGTIQPWVEAHWHPNTEADLAGYEIHFFFGTSLVPTVYSVMPAETSVRLSNVAGGITVRAKMLAFDAFHNLADPPFTDEVSITTASDTAPPGPPTNIFVHPSFKAVAFLWTPPADLDYSAVEVWAAQTNDRAVATLVTSGATGAVHEGLGSNATWYYWLRSRDTSGNVSPFAQGVNAGLAATTVQTTTADIGNLSITSTQIADNAISTPKLQANAVTANKVTTGELITLGAQIRNAIITDAHINALSAEKITAGVLDVFVQLGVAGRVFLDGTNARLYITDVQSPTPITRVLMGQMGGGNADFGLQLFGPNGELQWNFMTGATEDGITDSAITARKIRAATVEATHLRTDTAVITVAAQIANAIIDDAHIIRLASEKILAGSIGVLWQLGSSLNSINLDGANTLIYLYDQQSPQQLRVMLGKLGSGPDTYGLQIFNAAGGLMWNFTDGAQTLGIADLAVTNAKIQNLQVNKLTAGAMTVLQQIGVGAQLFLDGTNAAVYVYDQQPQIRAMFGRQGAGSTDYGLRVWGADGALMYDFTNGASTRGINPFAVSESLAFFSSTTVSVSVGEVSAGSLTFPALDAGDQVWLSAMTTGATSTTDAQLIWRIREDGLAGAVIGNVLVSGSPGQRSVSTQAVYTAPSALSNKTFLVTLLAGGDASSVSVVLTTFVGFRRRR